MKLRSPNHGGPLVAPSLVVLHYTAGPTLESAASWMCDPASKVSAHYVIGRDGETLQLVDENRIAWHAGRSKWRGRASCNQFSIGIELVNLGPLSSTGPGKFRSLATGAPLPADQVFEGAHQHGGPTTFWHVYPEAQLAACQKVLCALAKRLPSLEEVVGHDDVARGRKLDPGPALPLERLRRAFYESRVC